VGMYVLKKCNQLTVVQVKSENMFPMSTYCFQSDDHQLHFHCTIAAVLTQQGMTDMYASVVSEHIQNAFGLDDTKLPLGAEPRNTEKGYMEVSTGDIAKMQHICRTYDFSLNVGVKTMLQEEPIEEMSIVIENSVYHVQMMLDIQSKRWSYAELPYSMDDNDEYDIPHVYNTESYVRGGKEAPMGAAEALEDLRNTVVIPMEDGVDYAIQVQGAFGLANMLGLTTETPASSVDKVKDAVTGDSGPLKDAVYSLFTGAAGKLTGWISSLWD
jgi:hypothetical protein